MKPKTIDPSNLPLEVCEHLSNKSMLCYEDARDPALWYPGDEDRGASYWCGLTQDAQGPDGEIVDPEYCRGSRVCCVPRAVPRPEA